MNQTPAMTVLTLEQIDAHSLRELLSRYGLQLHVVADADSIPGSFWGESEAGLIGDGIYARPDTPIHSVLHEACHYICMDAARRANLHTDAGGGTDEENGVCYLQILLAAQLPEMGMDRMLADMDAWGYSFRLGSARAWFENDAIDARDWLTRHGLINHAQTPAWTLRT
jgi:hypothetical protein